MLIDDQILRIGRNLHDFLMTGIVSQKYPHLFEQQAGVDRAPLTWIDAICINQEDLNEKALQVSIMSQIYTNASTVIAWLGGEDIFSRPALYALVKIANYGQEVTEMANLINPVHTDMTKFGLTAENPSFPIYAFFKRAWFRRAWIVQEAVLAKRLLFSCGKIVSSFTLLTRATAFLYSSGWWSMISSAAYNHQKTGLSHSFLRQFVQPMIAQTMTFMERGLYEPDLDTFFDPMYAVSEILDARARFQRDNDLFIKLKEGIELHPLTYGEIFTRFRMQESSDAKDKIYAFLGLRPTREIPPSLMPNYARDSTAEQVYTAATLQLLNREKNLRILSQVEDRSERTDTRLPSWVPDFHKLITGITIGDSVFSPWSSAGDLPFYLNSDKASEGLLELRGICVDYIVETAQYKDDGFSKIQRLLMLLRPYYKTMEPPESCHIIHWQDSSTQNTETSTRRAALHQSEDSSNEHSECKSSPFLTRAVTRQQSDPGLYSYIERVETLRLEHQSPEQQPARPNSIEGLPLQYRSGQAAPVLIEELDDWLTDSDDIDLEESHDPGASATYLRGPARPDTTTRSLWLPATKMTVIEPISRIQTRVEVLLRTLIADCCDKQHPAPLKYGFAFAYWIKREMHQAALLAVRQMLSRNSIGDDGEENQFEKYSLGLRALRTLIRDEPGDFAELPDLLEAQNKANAKQQDVHGDDWTIDIQLGPTRFLPDGLDLGEELTDERQDTNPDAPEFCTREAQISDGRFLFTTRDHLYLGIGPKSIATGDQVWLLAGGNVPYILRPKENGNYELIG